MVINSRPIPQKPGSRRLAALNLAALSLAATVTAAGCAFAAEPAKPVKLYPQAINITPGQPDISGVWSANEVAFSSRPSAERRVKTVEGKDPPLQPWAQKLYDERAKLADLGTPFANTASRCLPNGMPVMMYDAPYPIQIIQQPGQVTMLFEEETTFRIIYLDEAPPEDPDPTYNGKSVGRFEGDTLVVQTVGLNDETTIDPMGLPHSDKLKVTERIRRLKPDLLENLITLDDPGAFTAPWTIRKTYRLWPIEKKILEYVCLENQRNAPSEAGHTGFGK